MSEVFIPLGGAGGKNRGEGVQVDENYTYLKAGNSGVALPLPAGNYKAMKAVHGEESLFSSYGDGKNAAVFMTKEFLKKVTLDLFGIASITNFSLTMYAHRQVRLTWAKPSQGLWSGVHFVFKYGSMPTSETDGFMQIDSADVYYTTDRLQETDLYVRAYNYVTVKDGRWYDDGAVSSHIRVTGINGAVTLSAGAGVWTVPDGVRRIRYILVGHGGAGTKWGATPGGGGGGGGGYFTTGYMDVSPGESIPWDIPNIQGQPTTLGKNRADSGKMSPRIPLPYTYNNGVPQYRDDPSYYYYSAGGDGGSGGGGSINSGLDCTHRHPYPGCGGENGSNGKGAVDGAWNSNIVQTTSGGKGQGSSTRGFNGVLYSGGGGGYYYTADSSYSPSTKFSSPISSHFSAPDAMEPTFDGAYYSYTRAGQGGDGGGGKYDSNGTDGLGGGGGGAGKGRGRYVKPYDVEVAGKGGTGCIYIAWGSLMNDGS